MHEQMNISILGCGWYGMALAKALINDEIKVKGSTTSPHKLALLKAEGIDPYLVNLLPGNSNFDAGFFNCDVLFIAIPPKARHGEGAVYPEKIMRIIEAIKLHRVKNVVFISSTGVYADLNKEVDETTPPEPDTEAGRVLFAAENLFRNENAFRTTIIRFAGLIGPGREPGRFFAGKRDIANGRAPVNLIHLDDCIGLSRAILHKQVFGYLFNASSPSHPKRSVFYTQATINSGMEKPIFIDELKEWKIVKSINIPEVLGYEFNTGII